MGSVFARVISLLLLLLLCSYDDGARLDRFPRARPSLRIIIIRWRLRDSWHFFVETISQVRGMSLFYTASIAHYNIIVHNKNRLVKVSNKILAHAADFRYCNYYTTWFTYYILVVGMSYVTKSNLFYSRNSCINNKQIFVKILMFRASHYSLQPKIKQH